MQDREIERQKLKPPAGTRTKKGPSKYWTNERGCGWRLEGEAEEIRSSDARGPPGGEVCVRSPAEELMMRGAGEPGGAGQDGPRVPAPIRACSVLNVARTGWSVAILACIHCMGGAYKLGVVVSLMMVIYL